MGLAAAIHHKAVHLGKLAVRMTAKAESGHPSSALSLAHLTAYLMYHQMHWDPANPWDLNADRLVLSEGHAVPIIYAALADRGATVGKDRKSAFKLKEADVDGLRTRDSVLDGHPNPAEGVPFFDAATGSLGQGLSVAAGLAAAARVEGRPRKVYAIIGDGEAREGQIWEAVDFIADHKLTNLCAIFNANGYGQASAVSVQQSAATLAAKLRAFHWDVVEIDGHDPDQIAAAFTKFGSNTHPLAIVARTVKGWGVEQMLKGNWHGKPLTMKDVEAAYASLDNTLANVKNDAPLGAPPKPASKTAAHANVHEIAWPSFDEAMRSGGLGAMLDKGKLGTRRAYGAALKVAGDLVPQVVALDGDVSNSTFAEIFAKAHPDRFFECKIAEQNMVSAAAGFAAAGMIPFANSFAKFISRAYDQVELANISRANIKLVGSHAGISLAADGPSQMATLDVAFFRAFATVRGDDHENPLCWSLQPADAVAAYKLTQLMVQLPGMCYMRTHRPDVPLLYKPEQTFEPRGFHVLNGGDDLAIVTSGYMVHECKTAVELLARQNIRATLIDAYCLPFDEERLAEAIQRAGGQALIVEDNYGSGLGSAVAEVAAARGNLRTGLLHVQRLPKSCLTPEEILDYCGVSARHVADHALALLRQPR